MQNEEIIMLEDLKNAHKQLDDADFAELIKHWWFYDARTMGVVREIQDEQQK